MTTRPMPPVNLGQIEGPVFAPAPDVLDWLFKTFVDEAGALHNPDHAHLEGANIGVLWAATGYEKQMRRVVGTAEQVMFRSSGWQRWRAEEQLRGWFGLQLPEFIITLDASFAQACSDVDWCALVEHELYHIGQELDEFGAPRFSKDGRPKLRMRGHDVEEFIGVVRRYGPSKSVAALVEAANARPSVPRFTVAHACGTCIERAA